MRLIQYVIEQGQKNKISVGICGELASDPMATLLLLGMGLEGFSMNPASIPAIKNIIVHNSLERAGKICDDVMKMDNSGQIITYLQNLTA